jgi:cellulase
MHHFLAFAACAGLVAAHGHVKEYIVDGNTYPSFDPGVDYDAKFSPKRIEWGFSKSKGNVGPVESVSGPE